MGLTDSMRLLLARLMHRGGTVLLPGGAGVTVGSSFFGGVPNYERMLRANIGWVYKAVQRRGMDVAASDPIPQERTGVEEFRALPETHPLVQLLARPNPLETGFEFRWRLQQIADLTGNAYILKVPSVNGRTTAELWVLDTRYMRVLINNEGTVDGYEYQTGVRTLTLPPERIIHLKYPNPASTFYGLSPLAAAAYEVNIDLLVKEHQVQFLKNSPTPRLAVESDGFLMTETIAALREQIASEHMGPHQGKPMILHQGAKVKVLNLSAQEINYLATRESMRDEILSLYTIPASILGLAKDVNRANAEANHFTYALYTLEPLARLRDEVLTVGLAREFGDNIRITHASLVPANRSEDRADTEMLIRNGITSTNEERTYRGWPGVPGGDEPTLPAGRIPLSQIGIDPLATPAKAAVAGRSAEQSPLALTRTAARRAYWDEVIAMRDPEEQRVRTRLKRYFAAQAKDVLGRLARAVREMDAQAAPLAAVRRDGPTLDLSLVSFDMEEWNDALTELGLTEVATSMAAAWEFAVATIGRSTPFDLTREAVRRTMLQSLAKMKDVNTTTRDALLGSIQEGIEANETMEQLAERVTQVYGEAAGPRAMRIARTLVTQATNVGTIEAWNRNGDLVKGKGWLSARDQSVRKPNSSSPYDHVSPDGQEVGLAASFLISGEKLQYPGDPAGSAGNIIACRCAIYPLLKEPEKE